MLHLSGVLTKCSSSSNTSGVHPSADHPPRLQHQQCHAFAAWRLLQDGQLLSFGRPTYGGLGRAAVDTQSDNAEPQPQRVDGLVGVRVTAAAAGGSSFARGVTCSSCRLVLARVQLA